jgi:hypothetical protein
MWTAEITKRFDALMDKYQGIFAMSFAGHTHMDDFRVYSNPNPILAIRTTPAVSPAFGNNPGISTFTFDGKTGEINDVKTFYTPLSSNNAPWGLEYQFSGAYGLKSYNAATLAKLALRIRSKGSAYKSYQKYYDVSAAPSPITDSNLPVYSCSETSFSSASFKACMDHSQ